MYKVLESLGERVLVAGLAANCNYLLKKKKLPEIIHNEIKSQIIVTLLTLNQVLEFSI